MGARYRNNCGRVWARPDGRRLRRKRQVELNDVPDRIGDERHRDSDDHHNPCGAQAPHDNHEATGAGAQDVDNAHHLHEPHDGDEDRDDNLPHHDDDNQSHDDDADHADQQDPAYTPPLRVTLVGENHDPIVNQKWTYTVTITDARGRKLSGTETTHYLFSGSVVGTENPVNVKFQGGVYRDTIEFPATAVGYPLVLQATIKTSIGTGTADWAITVKK